GGLAPPTAHDSGRERRLRRLHWHEDRDGHRRRHHGRNRNPDSRFHHRGAYGRIESHRNHHRENRWTHLERLHDHAGRGCGKHFARDLFISGVVAFGPFH